MAKKHGALEAGQLPRARSRDRTKSNSCQRGSSVESPLQDRTKCVLAGAAPRAFKSSLVGYNKDEKGRS